MANYLNIESEGNNIDLKSYGKTVCMPDIIDCRASCELIAKDCAQLFNCSLEEGATPFCLKYETGGVFDIQLRLVDEFNPDPTNPASGWGLFVKAELLDVDGVVVSSDYTAFSNDYVVGYTEGVGSYQTIQIDFDKCENLAGTCFSIKFKVYDDVAAETDVYCTETFKKLDDCEDLLYIESKYSFLDCCGNYYGLADSFVGSSNFAYSNKIGIWAVMQNEEGAVEVETSGTIRTTTTIRDQKNISLLEKIPFYLHKYIRNVFAGENLFFNDIEFLMDGFTPEINVGALPMFIYNFNIYTECEKKFGCN